MKTVDRWSEDILKKVQAKKRENIKVKKTGFISIAAAFAVVVAAGVVFEIISGGRFVGVDKSEEQSSGKQLTADNHDIFYGEGPDSEHMLGGEDDIHDYFYGKVISVKDGNIALLEVTEGTLSEYDKGDKVYVKIDELYIERCTDNKSYEEDATEILSYDGKPMVGQTLEVSFSTYGVGVKGKLDGYDYIKQTFGEVICYILDLTDKKTGEKYRPNVALDEGITCQVTAFEDDNTILLHTIGDYDPIYGDMDTFYLNYKLADVFEYSVKTGTGKITDKNYQLKIGDIIRVFPETYDDDGKDIVPKEHKGHKLYEAAGSITKLKTRP